MIDGTPEGIKKDIEPLRELKARHGVFGVTGNHEYYFDVHRWLPVFRELGVEMLQNECRTLMIGGRNVLLAGLSDPAGMRHGESGPNTKLLRGHLPQGVRILLQHRPSGPPSKFEPDLQLSGHTHGGHLFFIKWLIASFNGGLVGGLFDVDQTKLYVSPGTGIWAGFSCRLGIPSEITRILLKSPASVENTCSLGRAAH